MNFANQRVQAGEARKPEDELANERVNTGNEPSPVSQTRLKYANDKSPVQVKRFDTGVTPNNQRFNRVGTGLRSTDFN